MCEIKPTWNQSGFQFMSFLQFAFHSWLWKWTGITLIFPTVPSLSLSLSFSPLLNSQMTSRIDEVQTSMDTRVMVV